MQLHTTPGNGGRGETQTHTVHHQSPAHEKKNRSVEIVFIWLYYVTFLLEQSAEQLKYAKSPHSR